MTESGNRYVGALFNIGTTSFLETPLLARQFLQEVGYYLPLRCGCLVRLPGLTSAEGLNVNGQAATCICFDRERQRWKVQLATGTNFNVKRENLVEGHTYHHLSNRLASADAAGLEVKDRRKERKYERKN